MPAALAAGAAVRVGSVAWSQRRWLLWLLVALLGIPLAIAALLTASAGGLAGELDAQPVDGFSPSALALSDIPGPYLQLYQAAGSQAGLDWAYLAAIGKIESDHGRSGRPGVRSGVNFRGCCAGPMQFYITGPAGGTWGAYAVDGNHDGKKDVYDPADAIPAAASLLKANGAPGDWSAAIFGYNHSPKYVADVKRQAELYRGAPVTPSGAAAGSAVSQRLSDGSPWLIAVPGTADTTCDRRIVPDVVLLMARYKMVAHDCFALGGHKGAGEHPLGLGIDLVPAPGGSWALLGRAARDLGWRDSCAYTGCAGVLPSPFRFIGWNGYSDGHHGDPAHVGAWAHLHLSWQHTPAAPGTPAQTVQTLLTPPSDRKSP